MKIPTFSKAQIIAAVQRAARKLGHAPSQAELLRIGGITLPMILPHFRTHGEAIRAAGLEPQKHGRVNAWVLLSDWGRVTREIGRPPSRTEYGRRGNHGYSTLESRFGNWSKVRESFTELVRDHGRVEEWADVVEMIRSSPIPAYASGSRWQKFLKEEQTAAMQRAKAAPASEAMAETVSADGGNGFAAPPTILPPELQGKKCVTGNMLAILFAIARERRTSSGAVSAGFLAVQSFPDRPVMGAPMHLGPLATEPVNEMGVMCLFVLLARRLGFMIDVLRSQFPDCEARHEVEPGRWQRVWIEFEFESISFRNHKHDPEGCDIIVCWRHNWVGCPKKLVVVELSRVVGSLGHLGIRATGEFHRGGAETRREIAAAENLTADPRQAGTGDADNNDLRRSGNA